MMLILINRRLNETLQSLSAPAPPGARHHGSVPFQLCFAFFSFHVHLEDTWWERCLPVFLRVPVFLLLKISVMANQVPFVPAKASWTDIWSKYLYWNYGLALPEIQYFFSLSHLKYCISPVCIQNMSTSLTVLVWKVNITF